MAVVVFDDGNTTGIWSDVLNWVGGALPLAVDTADMNEDCALDMNDIIARLDVLAGKTLTMGAGTALTGMTDDALGQGKVYMNAGCELSWDTAADKSSKDLEIVARGTSGNRCLITNVGAGRLSIVSSTSKGWDCEYTDIHNVFSFFLTGDLLRLIVCDLEGAAASNYVIPLCTRIILRDGWISNFDSAVYGGLAIGYGAGTKVIDIQNMVWGEDIDGNAQPNAKDWVLWEVAGQWGKSVRARNVMLLSATPIHWNSNTVGWSRVVIDNYGFCATHLLGSGPGTPGVGYIGTPFWTGERSAAAKKTGDFGARITPKAGCGDAIDKDAELVVFIPIATGDDISVSVFGRRHTMTNDCAEVEIDPEGAWFTPDTSAPVLADDTWVEFTPSAVGAGGAADSGMVRIVLRLKEFQGAAFFDWADMVVTVT